MDSHTKANEKPCIRMRNHVRELASNKPTTPAISADIIANNTIDSTDNTAKEILKISTASYVATTPDSLLPW
jgi:hypothetical protein